MFSRAPEGWEGDAPHIFTHRSDSVREECAFAAAYIRRLVQSGARYREITVAVSDPAVYLPQLRSVLARMELPAYFAGTTPLVQSSAVAALRSALRAAEGYDYEDVVNYLKSPLSPLTREAADLLERYAFRWDLHGLAWERPLTFHPRGYGEVWEEEDRAALNDLESWRDAAVAPLQALRLALRQAATVAAQTEAVAAFLEQTGLAHTLAARSAALQQTDAQRAQQAEQIYECLMHALEQLWQIAGKQTMEAGNFLQLLDLLLSCYQIGTIPAKADEIQIGPLPAMRHRQTKYLLLLGAEEGKFPAFQTPNGLLTDEERIRLHTLGLTVAPAQEARLERELGWICAALSAVTEQVILSTGGGQPSYLFERTEKLFPRHPVLRDEDYPYLPDPAAAAAPFVRQEQTQLLAAHPALLQSAWELRMRREYDFPPLSSDTVRSLYGREIQLSASKIDKFSACKYQYFLRYGLKSQPWKQAKFDAPVFGTFVHYVLEQTVRDVMTQGGFHAVSAQELSDLAETHIQVYARTFLPDREDRGARFAYLFDRSRREVLEIVADIGRELQKSDFAPVDTELSFARDGALPPVGIQARLGSGSISGFVDRVDLYDAGAAAYYRVIDYKTGHKEFDYAALLQGEGLQMLIYLFALRKYGAARYGKPIYPAGVLYVPGRADVERIKPGTEQEKSQKLRQSKKRRKGLVLADEEILQAMEHGERPEYLPLQRKKDGLTGDLATREQFAQMERFVELSLQRLTDSMLSGQVAPDPLIRGPKVSSCKYCDYQDTCHQDLGGLRQRYCSSVEAEQFWNEVERRIRDAGHIDESTAGGR